jgi:uncharacterized alkaline shock family protein YloU
MMTETTATASRVTTGGDLVSPQGKTTIADSVVEKVAGIAAREVAGVYELGGGAARAIGALRERIPATGGKPVSQGVRVEVGERQAAVDIDLVAEYGVSIIDVAGAVRRNVISSVERITGLEVTEVNISVGDIHIEDDSEQDEDERRVQ